MPRLRKCPDHYLASEVDGELILIHGETGRFFALKDVGFEIWKMLDHYSDVDQLCAQLTSEYEVDEGECRAAVDGFSKELVEAGLAEFA